jgi:signal transduction histidine kinase
VLLLAAAFVVLCVVIVVGTAHGIRIQQEGVRISGALKDTITLNQSLRQTLDAQVQTAERFAADRSSGLQDRFERLNFEFSRKHARYLALGIGPSERLSVEKIKDLQAEIGHHGMRLFEATRRGDRETVVTSLDAFERLQGLIHAEFDEISRLQVARLDVILGRFETALTRANVLILGVTIVFALLMGSFMLLLRWRVIDPLERLLAAAGSVRRGRFENLPTVRHHDEIGRLGGEFNFMARSLAKSYAELERRIEERTSQLRSLQRQLVQAEKMSAMGQLVAGVAHELNNPLTSIIGFTEIALDQLSDSVADDRQRRRLEAIMEQSRRCGRIVANLLQFARQDEPRTEMLDLGDVVAQSLRLREYELRTSNIRLIKTIKVERPQVLGDRTKIQQLVLILVNNAVDAILERGGNGTIWAEVGARDGWIELEVRDDGTGIREPERVFDPFYTTKGVGKGTGLGLSVCYGIVREHGGEVRADNWDHGARFVVRLPQGEQPVDLDAAVHGPEEAS